VICMAGASQRSLPGGAEVTPEGDEQGPVSKGSVEPTAIVVARRKHSAWWYSFRLLAMMAWLCALAPIAGFIAGMFVNLVTHWYKIGLGI
jgi:hypothetical protein